MINRTTSSMQENTSSTTVPKHFLIRAWMEKIKLTNVDLAKSFSLTPARVSYILRSGECPKKYIDILRNEFEMPEELLPTRSREKSGPKPKKSN